MKAIDKRPAVIKAIGAPLTALGNAALSKRSLKPANKIMAKVNPMALANAKHTELMRL